MIFSGVNSHLRFGSVSHAGLLLSGTRLVRDLRSIPSIQKEAEFIVLASDVPFSALTPRLRFLRPWPWPHCTNYKMFLERHCNVLKSSYKSGFSPKTNSSSSHLLLLINMMYPASSLLHEPQKTLLQWSQCRSKGLPPYSPLLAWESVTNILIAYPSITKSHNRVLLQQLLPCPLMSLL